MPYAASTRGPAASSTPSAIIAPAPSQPSSPGWNMNTTSPRRTSACAVRRRTAPTSIAMCRSCPQACIAPAVSLAKSTPLASVTGRASMSPRSSTVATGP